MTKQKKKPGEKFYVPPQRQKKNLTVQSVAKHLTKEVKKEEKKGKTAEKKDKLDQIEAKLKTFTKFYQTIPLVPDNEWRTFLKEHVGTANLTFRFISTHLRCSSHLDTVPGIPSQRDIMVHYMKKKFEDNINKMVVDNNMKLSLAPLPWYPNDWGWMMNIAHVDMGKYLGLKDFYNFLSSERSQYTIQQLETWSMLPPLLLTLQPYYRVLSLCASPGFIEGQVSEIMHSDPNLATDGLIVLNDWWHHKDRMQYRWCQGMKVLFTNEDAKSYPDLYISNKNEPLVYDRVICDVKCSKDGTMRKNVTLQDHWDSQTALINHKDQLAILRRGMELVKTGGIVLYSTTSMNPIENEAVVMAMLKEAGGRVDLVDVKRIVPNFKFRSGFKTWKVMSSEGFMFPSYKETTDEFQKKYPDSVFPPPLREATAFHMDRCGRVLAHDNSTAGFFCALLVKNKELPSVIAKRAEAQAAIAPEPEETVKKYGYTIQLMPQLALTEIEWTVENTNRFLQTKTKKEIKRFPLPEPEIDPRCQPKSLVPFPDLKEVDEAYGFSSPKDEDWMKIKEFFKISDNFDAHTLVLRDGKRQWHLSSLEVRNIVKLNRKRLGLNIQTECGVLAMYTYDLLPIPCDSTCKIMFTEEGFSAMYPYIGKQVVKVTRDDILALAYNEKVKITELSEIAQADITETEQGCILFVYRPKDFGAIPRCNLTFVGARGESYIMDYKEGTGNDRRLFFRLCGLERDDYRRKIQEEKLARVLEVEREKKAHQQEEMDIS